MDVEIKDGIAVMATSRKYAVMIFLSGAFFCLGLPYNVLGPTLPTLSYNMGVEVSDIAYVIPAKGAGYLFGSIICGFLFSRFDGQRILSLLLFISAAGGIVLPLISNPILLAVSLGLIAISMGGLDTGGNVLCLQLWGVHSEPYMQTMHFSWSVGAFLAPLLSQPFINNVYENNGTFVPEANFTISTENMTSEETVDIQMLAGVPRVAWCFFIAAFLSAIVSIGFLVLSCTGHGRVITSQHDTSEEEGQKFRRIIITMLAFFYFNYVGLEVAFGTYIYTFAIESSLQYSKYQGTTLNFVFWLSFATGRFFSIFLTKCFNPTRILTFDLVGSFAAALTMLFSPYYASTADFIMWVAVILLGWSMASVFPSGISWAESYITMTEKTTFVLVIGAALGEMILPTLVGALIYNPMNLMYFSFLFAVLNIITFIIMHKYASSHGKRIKKSSIKNKNNNEGEEKMLSHQEEPEINT